VHAFPSAWRSEQLEPDNKASIVTYSFIRMSIGCTCNGRFPPIADIKVFDSIRAMAIEKTRLFERTRGRWPLTVHVVPKEGVRCFEATPCLNEVYRTIEASSKPAGEWTAEDNWTHVANWSFHQALWTLAERPDERHLDRNEVTFDMLDRCIRENLSDDCWDAERLEYEESPSLFH
jgi:hypothetical protein